MIKPTAIIGSCGRLALGMGRGLLDAVYPAVCGLCGSPEIDGGEVVCETCLSAMADPLSQAYCPRCGSTTPAFGLLPTGCGSCPSPSFPFDRVIRVGAYSGAFAELVRVFKYKGREEFMGLLVRELSRRIARSEIYEEIDAITMVPTCWQHRMSCLFYPPRTIARGLARRYDIPLACVLRRTGGPHQLGLSATERRQNVRGRFYLARGCRVDGARLCLVDDVMTTGATAGECARVLKAAGAAAVYAVVLAKRSIDARR